MRHQPNGLSPAEVAALRDLLGALLRHLHPDKLEPDSPWRETFRLSANALVDALKADRFGAA